MKLWVRVWCLVFLTHGVYGCSAKYARWIAPSHVLVKSIFFRKLSCKTHTDLHNRSTAVPWRQNGRHQVYSRQNWPLSSCYRLMIGYRSPWWKFVSHHQTEREYATVWNQFFEMAANCHPFHFRRRPCRVLPNRQTSWWLITPSRARAGFYPVTN